ncbi:MAG: thioredoxin [Actinomycetota bacterium]|nr:thioredoxin [Actinomycetota bacterium]
MATEVTEANFQSEVLESEQPVIVDFWAEWCAPCHMVAPILDQIAEERGGDLRLAKVNIDEQPALAQRFGIQSIPTIVLFKGGEPAAAALGAQPKGMLEKALGLAEA